MILVDPLQLWILYGSIISDFVTKGHKRGEANI